MSQTPTPRPAGRRKTLAFVIGGLILIGAVGIAFFADRAVMGGSGRAITPSTSTAPAPVANPAEPAINAAPGAQAPANP